VGQAASRVLLDKATYSHLPAHNKRLIAPGPDELTLKGQRAPVRPYVYASALPLSLTAADDQGAEPYYACIHTSI
jgi:hypothetical protein